MQSGQSPPQSVVKRFRAYGNALYKCHAITITITSIVRWKDHENTIAVLFG